MTTTPTHTLALLLLPEQAAFFTLQDGAWHPHKIRGEAWSKLKSAQTLPDLLEKLSDSINRRARLATCEIHVLYDVAALQQHPQLAEKTAQTLADLQCQRWQWLRLEPLRQRAMAAGGRHPGADWPLDWIQQSLLPVLENTFGPSDPLEQARQQRDQLLQAQHQHAQQAHEETLASLRAERSRLTDQLLQLRQQLASSQQPDLENLLCYLPALYRNVWSSIAPSDLALLAGSLEIPAIASPFPEPQANTLNALQRRLRNLPDDERQRLHRFCRSLTHKLDTRPEMRAWLEGDTP